MRDNPFPDKRKHSADWWKRYSHHESKVHTMKCLDEFHQLSLASDVDEEVLANHLQLWHGRTLPKQIRSAGELGKLHLRLHAEKA